jgi:hypothetical protein
VYAPVLPLTTHAYTDLYLVTPETGDAQHAPPMAANKLFYGDNLDVLQRYVAPESVDLVYLDPPFNSQADYNILFEEHGERAAAQIKAFGDTWEWNTEAARSYAELLAAGGDVAVAMRAFRSILGDSDMLAYLAMMAPRLIALANALKANRKPVPSLRSDREPLSKGLA